MKKAYKKFKYSAETEDTVIARANTLEEVENIARKQMFLYKLINTRVTIFEKDTAVKTITL